jgi:hypothetical protein
MKFARGILAEPIIREDKAAREWLDFPKEWRTAILGNDARRERQDVAERRAIAAEDRRVKKLTDDKLNLLASHFGASKGGRTDWRLLATKLAQEIVPGFSILDSDPKKGRPRDQDGVRVFKGPLPTKYRSLWHDVRAEMRKQKGPVTRTLDALVKRKGSPWYGMDAPSLRKRFYDEKRERDSMILNNSAASRRSAEKKSVTKIK